MKARLIWLGCAIAVMGLYAQMDEESVELVEEPGQVEMVEQEDIEIPSNLDEDIDEAEQPVKKPIQKISEKPKAEIKELTDPEDFDEDEDRGQDDVEFGQEEDDAVIQGFLRSDKKAHDSSPVVPIADLSFDIGKKRQEVIDLVTRAASELDNQPLDIACNRFTHTKEFLHGDLYVFLFDMSGVCLAHGDDADLLWRNMIDDVDWVGTPFVKHILKKAKTGGGWVTYGWNNSTKVSYVQLVEKDGKSYAIGSGYFPHSKEEAVINLVKGAVALFNRIKSENQPVDWAFSRMSYPSGRFVAGNLYLYALDFKGNIVAQGERPGLINSNAWDYKDENGIYVNREIVKKLQNTSEGVWIEYLSKRATKKAYAEKVVGKDGKQYFIACGYYPDANRTETINLVRKGYQFMKTTGKSNAVEEFSSRRNDDFRFGDLFLVVYDLKGKIIADGGNADNIGRRMWDVTDEDGRPYIQNIIKRATKQGIWVNAKIKGSFQSTYAQRVDLGINQYVITCSYYPVSKSEMMMLLVQSGASFLQANPREQVFAEFVKRDGRFRRGDLELIAVDTAGLCYAYGDDFDLIWRNILDVKDEAGRPFIKMFINEVRKGPVIINTKLNGATKVNYVTSVEKEGKVYIISSGFYK